MKFDAIIGNPPYQLSNSESLRHSTTLYHKFIEKAKSMNPSYLSMIVPARWYSGGKGLDTFRKEMLNDTRIKELHDIPNANDAFPGVSIEGGVCYFLWDNNYSGDCTIYNHQNNEVISSVKRPLLEKGNDILIRNNKDITVFSKVRKLKEESFAEMVSSRKPFGLRTFFRGEEKSSENTLKIYQNGGTAYINRDIITKNTDWIDQYKVLISEAYGMGKSSSSRVLGKPIVAAPNTCCTETYLVVGRYDDQQTAENVQQYMTTKFFRFMVSLIKNTQHGTKKVYQFVPMQDFSKSWTDEELYAKYGLTKKEIAHIEAVIKPQKS